MAPLRVRRDGRVGEPGLHRRYRRAAHRVQHRLRRGAEPGPRERQHPVTADSPSGLDYPPGGRGSATPSRRLLSQVAVPYEGLQITPELQEPFEFAEGFDGVRQLAVYTDPASGNEAAVYLISVTDDEDARIYSVAVGCSVECFMEHQEKISEVVDSWLVNVRA